MKKLASLILAAVLMLTLAVPAAAAPEAPSSDQRLAAVTTKVKATLGIGDEYTDFYGNLSENEISPFWDLFWSGDGVRLNVEATETGKILSYNLSENDNDPYAGSGNFPPTFPAVSRAQARQYAETFLKKVLETPLESFTFSERNTGQLSTTVHRFYGEIRLNGLMSPLTFHIYVRASDGKVTQFYRESLEDSVLGSVPSSRSSITAASAGTMLKRTMDLRLEYVLTDEKDSKNAVLRYLPEPSDSYYVDAQTGKLVNLTELYEKLSEEEADGGYGGSSASNGAAAPEASADTFAGLSQAELTGVAKLEGVQSKEDLDKILQKYSALGLNKYTLASASYSLDKETEDVTARLIYTRKEDSGTCRRTVVCDGKTGELQSVYSSRPYSENRKAAVSMDAARKNAEAFLTEFWGDDFAKTELYDSAEWENTRWNSTHSFTYAQKENGYFFPENGLRVSIDIIDGTVSAFDRSWTDDVAFDSPDDILDKSAALDAWFAHYALPLAYRSIPVKLDPGMDGAAPLMDMGYSYFYALQLSYAVEEEDKYASGVDARTGEIIYPAVSSQTGEITYSDVADHWAKTQIETLASYGIGWQGGKCEPRKELTQFDFITLLLSTEGNRYGTEESEVDELYNRAYQRGIVTRAERADSKILTRGEAVKMLLNSAGYGNIAKLQGIFTCSFPDRTDIPETMLGWAALAQGLGVVDGGSTFAADRNATRAEAVVMLYNFMNQK